MCILQIRGERPFLSKKYDIEKHKNYKLLSDFDSTRHLDVKAFLENTSNTDIDMKEFYKGDVYVVDPSIFEKTNKKNR